MQLDARELAVRDSHRYTLLRCLPNILTGPILYLLTMFYEDGYELAPFIPWFAVVFALRASRERVLLCAEVLIGRVLKELIRNYDIFFFLNLSVLRTG